MLRVIKQEFKEYENRMDSLHDFSIGKSVFTINKVEVKTLQKLADLYLTHPLYRMQNGYEWKPEDHEDGWVDGAVYLCITDTGDHNVLFHFNGAFYSSYFCEKYYGEYELNRYVSAQIMEVSHG